jgi:four helix bundle protein
MATGLENLKIYGMAEDLEILVHKILKSFPIDEKFRTVDQLKRSSASVSNNIAEGYNRYSYQEKIRYLIIAKAEAEETKRNILRSARKEFLSEDLAERIGDQYTELIKAISGYIRFLKDRKLIAEKT